MQQQVTRLEGQEVEGEGSTAAVDFLLSVIMSF